MTKTAFIGGGNMAMALIGGLRRAGTAADDVLVVEPQAEQRERLAAAFGVRPLAAADASLAEAAMVVWAVKPQHFAEAAEPVASHIGGALQLSVMAGLRSAAIAARTGNARVVRAMPNTPALIGLGISGLYARPEVDASGRAAVEAVLAPTGQLRWVVREEDLDAVTALSGSGPAYVFYMAEAMVQAGVEMGLAPALARELALATFTGASALAAGSDESLADLRARVTSKGGTTHAAIESMKAAGVGDAIRRAVHAAQQRARELGDQLG
jgi:pyrroline-5-carboxylate reductase